MVVRPQGPIDLTAVTKLYPPPNTIRVGVYGGKARTTVINVRSIDLPFSLTYVNHVIDVRTWG